MEASLNYPAFDEFLPSKNRKLVKKAKKLKCVGTYICHEEDTI
jgi:hypothetical protein